jgi:hypothetical protein
MSEEAIAERSRKRYAHRPSLEHSQQPKPLRVEPLKLFQMPNPQEN